MQWTVNERERIPLWKFASKQLQNDCAEQPTWTLSLEKHILPLEGKKTARCNLLITRELFHIQMLLLCLEDGCGHLILLASRAVASLWRPQSHLLYQIMPSDWSPLSAGNKMANAQQYLPKSTALRTDLQHNKVAQPSSKLSEQHKMARLFTGERNEKQKRKKKKHIL